MTCRPRGTSSKKKQITDAVPSGWPTERQAGKVNGLTEFRVTGKRQGLVSKDAKTTKDVRAELKA